MTQETPETADVLIIGAGIAGLEAAKELHAHGCSVLVLEKSRGLGGRSATRRWEGLPVDHGSQFFTARSAAFREQVDHWLKRGVCHEWTRGLHQYSKGSLRSPESETYPRFACHRGMSSLGRDLAGVDCDYILSRTKVIAISLEDRQWTLATEDGRTFKSKSLLVTSPPPQAASLLSQAAPEAAEKLARITMAPCLAVAARYSRRIIPWHGIQCQGHPVLSWIGHDSSKRQDLHPQSTVLVFHATAEFSAVNFASEETHLTEAMTRAASEIVGEDLSAPQTSFVQRWRYAMATQAPELNQQIVSYDHPAKLVLAGDAIAGGKVEGAWLSGLSAAQHLKTCAV
jgi:hypothetical protein